jgi:hypothetical protein
MNGCDREVIRPGDLTAEERAAIAAAEVPVEYARLDDEVTESSCASDTQSPAGRVFPLYPCSRRVI